VRYHLKQHKVVEAYVTHWLAFAKAVRGDNTEDSDTRVKLILGADGLSFLFIGKSDSKDTVAVPHQAHQTVS
jgi:hypothetical protein